MHEVAAVQGKVGDFFGGDDLAQRRIRSLYRDLRSTDFDGRGDRRRQEAEIDLTMLVDLQPNVLLLGGLESLRLHVNRVERDRQQRDQVISVFVGLGFAGDALPSDVTFTVAPVTTAPALSETVPEKLPLAWPYRSGQAETASEKTIATNSVFLFNIPAPLGGPAPNDEVTFRLAIDREIVGP